MSTTLAGWSPSYFMTLSSGITDNGGFTTASALGPSGESGYPAVYLTNRPEFNPNQEILSSDKATSFPFPVQGDEDVERTLGTQSPEATYEFDMDVRSLFIPMVTLLQPSSGNVDGTSADVKTISAYTSGVNQSNVDYYAYLFRRLDDSNNQEIRGCIANSVNISGSEGEILTTSVDFTGSQYATTGDTPGNGGTWEKSNSFKMISFDDIYVKMGSGISSTQLVDVTDLDLTIGNNVVAKYYNNQTIQRYILGNLEISLSLSMPWSSDAVTASNLADWLGVDGDDTPIHVQIGTSSGMTEPAARGEFLIDMYGAIDDTTSADGDEITNSVDITGLMYSGNPFVFKTYDEVDRSNFF